MIFSVYYITMEDTSSTNRSSSFPLWILVDVFLVHKISNWVNFIHKFVPRFHSFLQSKLDFGNSKVRSVKSTSSSNSSFEEELSINNHQQVLEDKKDVDVKLSREDVTTVMETLGIFCSPESEELQDWFSSNNLPGLFEEEPSLKEVKEAFDVFDKNGDGFIDAEELQRVLSLLGLKQGSDIENCKRMIRSFDENRDGRIDFNEYVKLMEASFC